MQDRTPVIVGIGEVTQKTKDLVNSDEPLSLMETALRSAAHDAGMPVCEIDSLDVIAEYSWPYADTPGQLAERLGTTPSHLHYGVAGGETPIHRLHEAALRIRRGEATMAAIVGAEANYAVATAERTGFPLTWSPKDASAKLVRGVDYLDPVAVSLGVAKPATVYPFFENAAQKAWGQTPREARRESAELWSLCSEVASRNANAWDRIHYTPGQIATPGDDNRLVAWPYTLRMVANPLVNQGAAILMMARGRALKLGIDPKRMIYPWCGAAAKEPKDYLNRDRFHRCVAQEAVLEGVLAQTGAIEHFGILELYSCFPVVPKMALRILALNTDTVVTATGGLSFFGAPLNNYMTHAACAIVRALRGCNDIALLYGQGGYMTNHHALVVSSRAPDRDMLDEDYDVQREAELRRGPLPRLDFSYRGLAELESFTVTFARDQRPQRGIAILRTQDGARLMAEVEATDARTIAAFVDLDANPIGLVGTVRGPDAVPKWSLS